VKPLLCLHQQELLQVAAQTAALTRTPSTQCPRSHHHMQQQLETALAQLLELEWWVLALLANSPT
jgi:hypothetical protein